MSQSSGTWRSGGGGFNEVLAHRVASVGLGTALVAIIAATLHDSSEEVAVDRDASRRSAADLELEERLIGLRNAWDPRDHERLLASAAGQDHLAGPLLRVLRRAEHPLMKPALQLAAALGDANLRPAVSVQTRARDTQVRAAAVLAADRLTPWSADELAALMTDGPRNVKLATLEIAAGRAHAPWSAMLALLMSEDAELSAAALKAMRSPVPPEVTDQLWRTVTTGSEADAEIALRALARADSVDAFEQRICDMLSIAGQDRLPRLLRFLAAKRSVLNQPEAVWRVVVDVSQTVENRARALHCLEVTGSADAQQLRDRVFAMEPLELHYAARCLLAAGHREAETMLLDLLAAEDAELVAATRRLLAFLSGASAGSTRQEFVAALSRASSRAAGILPPADLLR